jgi:hypothetical protein
MMPNSTLFALIGGGLAALLIVGLIGGLVYVGSTQQQSILANVSTTTTTTRVAIAPTATAATNTTTPMPQPTATFAPVVESPTQSTAPQPDSTALPTISVVQETATTVPVVLSPLRITASDEAPASIDSQQNTTTFVAENAVDGQMETAWRVPGDGVNQSLMLAFAAPVRVHEIALVPGYAKVDPFDQVDRFAQNRRVVRARFEFSSGESVEARFADRPELQVTLVNDTLTTYVRVVILETTAPGANDGRDFTPISEIVVMGTVE